jgi:hypothetical protein
LLARRGTEMREKIDWGNAGAAEYGSTMTAFPPLPKEKETSLDRSTPPRTGNWEFTSETSHGRRASKDRPPFPKKDLTGRAPS